jgi:hypothetical protein
LRCRRPGSHSLACGVSQAASLGTKNILEGRSAPVTRGSLPPSCRCVNLPIDQNEKCDRANARNSPVRPADFLPGRCQQAVRPLFFALARRRERRLNAWGEFSRRGGKTTYIEDGRENPPIRHIPD